MVTVTIIDGRRRLDDHVEDDVDDDAVRDEKSLTSGGSLH